MCSSDLAILSGELKEEEALPSLRTLAKDLKISVLTVTRAYTELEQEGFVKNVCPSGKEEICAEVCTPYVPPSSSRTFSM